MLCAKVTQACKETKLISATHRTQLSVYISSSRFKLVPDSRQRANPEWTAAGAPPFLQRSLTRSLTTAASITTCRSCSLAVALESMTDIVTATRQLSAELVADPDVEQLQVCSICNLVQNPVSCCKMEAIRQNWLVARLLCIIYASECMHTCMYAYTAN